MFKNDLGDSFENGQAIFPLVTFNKNRMSFRCIGTGFFIHRLGWFVTAKHVLFDNKNNLFEMMMSVQTLSNGLGVSRMVTHLSIHPNADIAAGQFGEVLDGIAKPVDYELAPTFRLSFKSLNALDKIASFGYPKTEKFVKDNLTTFNFRGKWSEGAIEELLPEGTPLIRNKCYQTSMAIDNGASGGPVIKDGYVIGINSSGMDLGNEIPQVSFITPIELLLPLRIQISNAISASIADLIQSNHVLLENLPAL